LKKENEVIINYSEKKEKKKNNLFKNDIICKNQEIFIEKSPVRNKEKENKHRKNLFSEQITRKYFTIINDNDNNNKENSNSLNSDNDNIIQKDIILNSELNKERKKLKINKENLKNKEKTKQNKRKNKHSKIPKKQPVVNIQIDLKDLIKLETLEKNCKNNKRIDKKSKPKKSKRFYDYPEDLKYNVFGKQYTFSYKDK